AFWMSIWWACIALPKPVTGRWSWRGWMARSRSSGCRCRRDGCGGCRAHRPTTRARGRPARILRAKVSTAAWCAGDDMAAGLACPLAANDAAADGPLPDSGIERLLDGRRLWKGGNSPVAPPAHATGHAVLDAALPAGGWPGSALSEILHAGEGVGEM